MLNGRAGRKDRWKERERRKENEMEREKHRAIRKEQLSKKNILKGRQEGKKVCSHTHTKTVYFSHQFALGWSPKVLV